MYQICPYCEGSDASCKSCWGTGLVDPHDDERPLVVVHKEEDGDEAYAQVVSQTAASVAWMQERRR